MELEASLLRTKPERWETHLMGMVAQAWMEEDRAKGIAEGRAGTLDHSPIPGHRRRAWGGLFGTNGTH